VDGAWKPFFLETNFFENQNFSKRLTEKWNKGWTITDELDYVYDVNDSLIELTYSDYEYTFRRSKVTYQYDTLNHIKTTDHFKWLGTQWQIDSLHARNVFEYNNKGYDSVITRFRLDSINYQPYNRSVYLYNQNDSISSLINQNHSGSSWFNSDETIFYYYPSSAGLIVYDTLLNNGYWDNYRKRTFDNNNDMLSEENYNKYESGPSQKLTYDCNHQISKKIYSSGGFHASTNTITTHFDTLCRPDISFSDSYYIYDGEFRILYSYPSPSEIILLLQDSGYVCAGDSFQIDLKIFGGTPPYQILWSPSIGLSNDTIAKPKVLITSPQVFTVHIVDSFGLIKSDEIFLDVKPSAVAHTSATIDTLSACHSAVLTVDSIPDSFVQWYLDGNNLYHHTKNYLATTNGVYIAKTSNDFCSYSDTLNLNSLYQTGPAITFQRYCNQLIAISPSAVSLQWYKTSSGILVGETNDTLDISDHGTYVIEAIDSFGCTDTARYLNFSPNNLSYLRINCCYDSCNGTISVKVPNEFLPATYQWFNGDTAKSISGLCVGNYSVTVTTAQGCVHNDTIQMIQTLMDDFTIKPSFVTTLSSCDGAALIKGPIPNLTPTEVTWENGETGYYCDSLCYGWNKIQFELSSNCFQEDSFFVDVGSSHSCNIIDSIIKPTCPDECGYDIRVKSFSTVGSTFFWPDFNSFGERLNSVCPDEYKCIMIDSLGCIDSTTIEVIHNITPIVPVILSYDATNPCLTLVELSLPDFPDATIKWCNDSTGNETLLCPGNCFVTIKSDYSCEITIPFNVEIPECGVFISQEEIKCNNECNGLLKATAAGVQPFTFVWNISDTSSIIDSLCEGFYTVYFHDDSVCADTLTVELKNPELLNANIITTYNHCYDDCETKAIITGGNEPYNITWCDTIFTSTFNHCITTCNVKIQDVRGCIWENTFEHIQPNTLKIFSEVLDATCWNCLDGVIRLSASGGILPYTYFQGPPIEWIMGDSLFYLPYGVYRVCVSDNNACEACMYATVGVSGDSLMIPNGNVIVYNSISYSTTNILIKNAAQYHKLIFMMYDMTGKLLIEEKITGNEYKINSKKYQAGMYFFLIKDDKTVIAKSKLMFLKN
jgi:hypothetical protein